MYGKWITQYKLLPALLLMALCLAGTVNTKAAARFDFQQISLKGQVSDSSGAAIAGATVLNKRNRKTTVTNSRGTFAIEAEKGDRLIISHIGYSTLNYTVEETTRLISVRLMRKIHQEEEVVVVHSGYQTISRERATGAYSVITNKELNEQISPNILDRLKNVSGSISFDNRETRPFSAKQTNVSVRGLSSINGYVDPLIVLDNFPYTGDIENINPNDVESITILKDATAASIWGAQAANGVIVITTKKSNFNKKLSIDINTSLTLSPIPNLYAHPEMSTEDYLFVEEYLFNKKFKLSDTSSTVHLPLTPVYEMLLQHKYGRISAQDSAAFMDDLKTVDPRKEYKDNFYQPALLQQYNLSMMGGSDNIAWLLAASHNRNTYNLKSVNQNQKTNIRIENSYRPFRNFEIRAGIIYTYADVGQYNAPAYKSILIGSKYVPYLRFKDSEGAPLPVDQRYRGIYTDTAGAGKLQDWKFYPLDDYTHYHYNTIRQDYLSQIAFSYRMLKNLQITLNYQRKQQISESRQLIDVGGFETRNKINLFTQRGKTAADPFSFPVPVGDILKQVSGIKNTTQNGRVQLNYTGKKGRYDFTGLAGGEISQTVTTGGYSSTIYGLIEDPLSYGVVDFQTPLTTFLNGSSQTIGGSPTLSPIQTNRMLSLFMNTALSYDQRYALNMSLRRDAANTFGLTTNDKWNPFWSVGGSWNLSSEQFYRLKWLSLVKFRTTIGIGGTMDPTKTALPVSGSGNNLTTNFPIRRIHTLNNPSLRWERSRQINFGLDFTAFKGRLQGSVDYYRKKGTDLYGPSVFDYTTWGLADVLSKNVASMKGKGWDISIRSVNVKRQLTWTSQLFFNYNRSETTDYFADDAKLSSFIGSSGSTLTPIIGKPLYSIVAYKWGGLNNQGDPQGYIDGTLSTDYTAISKEARAIQENGHSSNFSFIGSADPLFFGSLINEWAIRKLTLSVNISYRLGYYFKRPSLQYGNLYNSGEGHQEFKQRWLKPGDEEKTAVPAMVYTDYPQFSNRDAFYRNSDVNVLRADNIRLQYINLNYQFNNFSQRGMFKTCSIGLNIADLGILWKNANENIDPDNPGSLPSPTRFTLRFRAGL